MSLLRECDPADTLISDCWLPEPGENSFSLVRIFNYEIVVDSSAVVRNNTERSYVPFTQSSSMVVCCKTVVLSQTEN